MGAVIEALHDPASGSVSYLVVDGVARKCAAIDCWLGFDPATGETDDRCVKHWKRRLDDLGVELEWILETHVHADRLTGSFALRAAAGGRIGIGEGVRDVAAYWQTSANANFDQLFADGAIFTVGTLPAGVLATPGHTPSCVTYLVADAAFVGDTLFMPHAGTARCDFPGGDARTLYRSIRRILELPPTLRILCAHDYGHACGRCAEWQSTVAQQRRDNVQVRAGISEDEFVALREERDKTLAPPQLLRQALDFNLTGRHLSPPPPAGEGI